MIPKKLLDQLDKILLVMLCDAAQQKDLPKLRAIVLIISALSEVAKEFGQV